MYTINKIESLLEERGYTQKALTDYLNIDKSTYSQWKKGKSKSYRKYIEKIADFLDVNVDCLLNEDLRERAIVKFGFCYDALEAEHKKNESRNKISEGNISDTEMIEEAINVYKALFSRSLIQSGYSLHHVDFPTYCAMMLNQNQRFIYGDLSDEKFTWLRGKLIEKFGVKKGIEKGTKYKISTSSKETKSFSVSENEKSYIKKYRTLDKFGKKAINDLLETEYQRCTAITEEQEEEQPTITIKYSFIPASAGSGESLSDEYTEPREYPDTPISRQADMVVPVSGDSMEPMYHDGEELYVRIQPAVNIGEIGIFMVDGKGYVKEYAKDRLISINPEYDDIYPTDFSDFMCVGKVLGRVE